MTTATSYAKALLDLSVQATTETSETRLVERLIQVMKKHGHLKLLPAVLRSFEQLSHKKHTREHVEIVTAHEHKETLARAREIAKDSFGTGITVTHQIDPTLVGGYVVRTKTAQIDASYKTKLLRLYQELINA